MPQISRDKNLRKSETSVANNQLNIRGEKSNKNTSFKLLIIIVYSVE